MTGIVTTSKVHTGPGGVYRWDGSTWSAFGTPVTYVAAFSNTVTADLPWIGSTWTATGTGLPSTAFVFMVSGFAPVSLPLAALLPQGVQGCVLHVSPDLLDMRLSNGGTAQMQVQLPNTASLVGQVFHHQMVPFEFDAASSIIAVTSTNALSLTIGSF